MNAQADVLKRFPCAVGRERPPSNTIYIQQDTAKHVLSQAPAALKARSDLILPRSSLPSAMAALSSLKSLAT